MKKTAVIGIGAGAVAALLLIASQRSQRASVTDDEEKILAGLLPSFARKVRQLLSNMRARGFDALLFEGYRSPERARELAARGTGSYPSQHMVGAAADIVSASTMWADSRFFKALDEEARKLGLTRVIRKNGTLDQPHVQAAPVRVQNRLYAMSPQEREAFVSTLLS